MHIYVTDLNAALRRTLHAGLIALAALGLAAPQARAQNGEEIAELQRLFADTCLQNFPDDGALKAYMSSSKHRAMTEEQVIELLKTDPGIGWLRRDMLGQYAVLLEYPPYHACSVRTMIRAGSMPRLLPGFQPFIMEWAAKNQARITPVESQEMKSGDIKAVMHMIQVLPLRGKTELMVAVETSYPGERYELRFVRKIPQR